MTTTTIDTTTTSDAAVVSGFVDLPGTGEALPARPGRVPAPVRARAWVLRKRRETVEALRRNLSGDGFGGFGGSGMTLAAA